MNGSDGLAGKTPLTVAAVQRLIERDDASAVGALGHALLAAWARERSYRKVLALAERALLDGGEDGGKALDFIQDALSGHTSPPLARKEPK